MSEDWKIAERRVIHRDPELRAETVKGIRELLATDDDEDRRVAYRLARGLLELEFDTDAELLAQLRDSVPA
jgi:predicted metal-dependent RNase